MPPGCGCAPAGGLVLRNSSSRSVQFSHRRARNFFRLRREQLRAWTISSEEYGQRKSHCEILSPQTNPAFDQTCFPTHAHRSHHYNLSNPGGQPPMHIDCKTLSLRGNAELDFKLSVLSNKQVGKHAILAFGRTAHSLLKTANTFARIRTCAEKW